MTIRTRTTKPSNNSLSTQMRRTAKNPAEKKDENTAYKGDLSKMLSTGSTLLDLAISGGVIRGGGIPAGILIEAFGQSGSGKTVVLCEIAGNVQRQGGDIQFNDPEARLNKQFARMFDLDTDDINYSQPDTVTDVFTGVRTWEPKNPKKINGIFTDSLAALSTELEMDNDAGDKMGMRRAKEFSEGFRKTCRILQQRGWLMVCSNQVRQNTDAGAYAEKYTTPGGVAVGFYSSLRLHFRKPDKIYLKRNIVGKEVKRVIGVETEVFVYKSSIDKPYRTAPLYIIFDYGIDDVRANLQFLKDYTKATTYTLGEYKLGSSMEEAIKTVENAGIESELREAVIDLWESIEARFESNRKPKQR